MEDWFSLFLLEGLFGVMEGGWMAGVALWRDVFDGE